MGRGTAVTGRLNSPSRRSENGFVFHVPLVQGDMDFSRLAFCLTSKNRDNASYAITASHLSKQGFFWGGATANRSYLPDAAHFVRHTGITPDGESIARHATAWLGWEEPVTPDGDDAPAVLAGAQQKANNLSRSYTFARRLRPVRVRWVFFPAARVR